MEPPRPSRSDKPRGTRPTARAKDAGLGHAVPASRFPQPPSGYPKQAPPSGRKQQGLLQTLNKLEQESENRAFELIHLRVRRLIGLHNSVLVWHLYGNARSHSLRNQPVYTAI